MPRDLRTGRTNGNLTMPTDPIVDEIRRIRNKLAAEFNYDVTAIARDARERQKASKRKVVSPKPRKIQVV